MNGTDKHIKTIKSMLRILLFGTKCWRSIAFRIIHSVLVKMSPFHHFSIKEKNKIRQMPRIIYVVSARAYGTIESIY